MENATNLGPESRTFDIAKAHIDVKSYLNSTGPPMEVTNSQECVLWHNISEHREKNTIPCALLKEYAVTVKYSGVPVYIWLPSLLLSVVGVWLCCRCCTRKDKGRIKEAYPLTEATVVGNYASNTTNRGRVE